MPRRWTFAVWMAGDNDLQKYADRDLAELKKVGSTAEVTFVAQVDRFKAGSTMRYLLRKGGKSEQDVVGDIGETDTGDPSVAADFFTWAFTTYPADRTAAVLWNHGSGIDETKTRGLSRRPRRSLFGASRERGPRPRGIGYDDTSHDFLDNVELARVLAEVRSRTGGRPIDLVGFDACLMSLVEIAMQVAPHARTLVSSQEVEPLDGWPYDAVAADLVARPDQTAADLARAIVERYVASYKYDIVTLSALDLAAPDACVAAVDGLARALLAATDADRSERIAFRSAVTVAQRFDTPDFLDLSDLCAQLSATSGDSAVRDACDQLRGTLSGLVISEGHRGRPVEDAHGVSIYVPLGGVSVDYARLALAQQTRWGDFVQYVEQWPKPAERRSAAERRERPGRGRRALAESPLRVLAVHGVGGLERDLAWQDRWRTAFVSGLGRYGDGRVEVEFLGLDDIFAERPITPAEIAEAALKLGASGLGYGLKDFLSGGRGFTPLDAVRWTAGMVVQWASDEALRAETRERLAERFAAGPPVQLLAAHSLGSLVTYDTFGRPGARRALTGTALLTFGSQLGSPFVRGQFGGRIEPLDVAFWCHAWSPHDPVFTAPLHVGGERFRQVVIERDLPGLLADHDALRYLRDPQVVEIGFRAAVPAERMRAAAPPERARKTARQPKTRALVVGIDDYPDPSARLEGCVNDAYLMSEVLQELGIPAQHVRLVLNRRATAAAIRERVEWLLDDTRDGDTCVFVYCGHGAQVPGYGGAGEVDHLDECLVPWDFDWTPDRAILDDWFNALYSHLPYRATFAAILDCCHSGGMARAGAARVRGLALPDDIRHRQLVWKDGAWSPRAIRLPNAPAVSRWAKTPSRIDRNCSVRKLGRAVGVRWLEETAGRDGGPLGRTRKAFGHKGPYMPLLLEACQEDELAYEHTAGTTPHGAFSYFLAQTIRSFRASRRALTVGRLMKETATEVSRRYKQTPRLECPTSRKGQRLI